MKEILQNSIGLIMSACIIIFSALFGLTKMWGTTTSYIFLAIAVIMATLILSTKKISMPSLTYLFIMMMIFSAAALPVGIASYYFNITGLLYFGLTIAVIIITLVLNALLTTRKKVPEFRMNDRTITIIGLLAWILSIVILIKGLGY